jgi:Cu/Ag efflux protein CusF
MLAESEGCPTDGRTGRFPPERAGSIFAVPPLSAKPEESDKENIVNRKELMVLASVALSLGALTAPASAADSKSEAAAKPLVKVEGTIRAIDLKTREVRFALADGSETTVVAGDEIQRLAELKVGDRVTMEYYESVTLSLVKTEGAVPGTSESAVEKRNETTELPGGTKTTQTKIVGKVTAIDAAAGKVTLAGANHLSLTLDVDAAMAAKLKVGDVVEAVYTTAKAISVARATK